MTSPQSPRIPPLPEAERDEQSKAMLDRIRVEGTDLNIFATLVRHPRLFKWWSWEFRGFLLYGGELSACHRELLDTPDKAFRTQGPNTSGASTLQPDLGLEDADIYRVVEGAQAPGWAPLEAALLVASDELHRESSISDDTWALLAAHLNEAQLIEVCMVVGQYHSGGVHLESAQGAERARSGRVPVIGCVRPRIRGRPMQCYQVEMSDWIRRAGSIRPEGPGRGALAPAFQHARRSSAHRCRRWRVEP